MNDTIPHIVPANHLTLGLMTVLLIFYAVISLAIVTAITYAYISACLIALLRGNIRERDVEVVEEGYLGDDVNSQEEEWRASLKRRGR